MREQLPQHQEEPQPSSFFSSMEQQYEQRLRDTTYTSEMHGKIPYYSQDSIKRMMAEYRAVFDDAKAFVIKQYIEYLRGSNRNMFMDLFYLREKAKKEQKEFGIVAEFLVRRLDSFVEKIATSEGPETSKDLVGILTLPEFAEAPTLRQEIRKVVARRLKKKVSEEEKDQTIQLTESDYAEIEKIGDRYRMRMFKKPKEEGKSPELWLTSWGTYQEVIDEVVNAALTIADELDLKELRSTAITGIPR